jgi:hypothetical protein
MVYRMVVGSCGFPFWAVMPECFYRASMQQLVTDANHAAGFPPKTRGNDRRLDSNKNFLIELSPD